MTYEEAFSHAKALWQAEGSVATIEYLEAVVRGAEGELRGRLLGLLAAFLKRARLMNRAYAALNEALNLVTSSTARLETFCDLMDICITAGRATEAEEHGEAVGRYLAETPPHVQAEWKPRYLFNLGNLAVLKKDAEGALPHFAEAARLFHASGRSQDGYMSEVNLAECMIALGQTNEAADVCWQIVSSASSAYVLAKAHSLLSVIEGLKNDHNEARRLLDKAASTAAKHIEDKDYRLLLELISIEALLDEKMGHLVEASRLRLLARRWAAINRADIEP